MPSLSQRPRRRAYEGDEEEAPRRRRALPDEREEEEYGEEEEEEIEEEGEEEEEEDRRPQRKKRQGQGTQSQRKKRQDQGTQSQRKKRQDQGTQSQRKKSARQEQESDDESDFGTDEDGVPRSQAEREEMHQHLLAKKIVRYALAAEPRRQPIRRQAVRQVLEKEGKHLKSVFPLAQSQLRDIFGMEMVDWPSRDEATLTLHDRRKLLRTQRQPPATKRKAASNAPRADRYALLSTLPEAYRQAVYAPLPSIKGIANPPAQDAAYVGFYTFVVSLITLNGGKMTNRQLERCLNRMYDSLEPRRTNSDFLKPTVETMGDHVDDEDGGTASSESTKGGTMQQLVRHGYVVRVEESAGPKPSRIIDPDEHVVWHVGPRGRLEVGPAVVASVVRAVYGKRMTKEMDKKLELRLQNMPNAAKQDKPPTRRGG